MAIWKNRAIGVLAGTALIAATMPSARGAEATGVTVAVVEPQIPAREFKLTDYGARGDGKAMETAAFAKAVTAVKEAGGGVLVVPAGTYQTGPFEVTDNMELRLEKGATIKATEQLSAYGYPDPLPTISQGMMAARVRARSLITGRNLNNFRLDGEGTIDGSGLVFWKHVDKPTFYEKGAVIFASRPRLLEISGKVLAFRGVTLTNSPSFHLVPMGAEHVVIEGVHIIAPALAPNTDAIDPSGCRNVLIKNCELDVGDDDVAIKAGNGGACDNIEIAGCTVRHGHGISIGSETFAGVKGMYVHDCNIEGAVSALRIKSAEERGGPVSDIVYERISMDTVDTAIELNMLYDPKNGPGGAMPGGGKSIPHLSHVVFRDITCKDATKEAMKIVGLPGAPIEDVRFENVKIHGVKGVELQDARGIVFKDLQLTVDKGKPIEAKDAEYTNE